jgi:DNA-binding transcriptional regulator GbsR (MarR family)
MSLRDMAEFRSAPTSEKAQREIQREQIARDRAARGLFEHPWGMSDGKASAGVRDLPTASEILQPRAMSASKASAGVRDLRTGE